MTEAWFDVQPTELSLSNLPRAMRSLRDSSTRGDAWLSRVITDATRTNALGVIPLLRIQDLGPFRVSKANTRVTIKQGQLLFSARDIIYMHGSLVYGALSLRELVLIIPETVEETCRAHTCRDCPSFFVCAGGLMPCGRLYPVSLSLHHLRMRLKKANGSHEEDYKERGDTLHSLGLQVLDKAITIPSHEKDRFLPNFIKEDRT